MEDRAPNWFESDGAYLHPTAPLTDERLFPDPMVLPAELILRATSTEVEVIYTVPADTVALELEIYAGRLVVTTEILGQSKQTRATTLPDDLDLSRGRVRLSRDTLQARYFFHRQTRKGRRWHQFTAWLQRLWSWLFG